MWLSACISPVCTLHFRHGALNTQTHACARFVIPPWWGSVQQSLAATMDALWQQSALLATRAEAGLGADHADVVIHAEPIGGGVDGRPLPRGGDFCIVSALFLHYFCIVSALFLHCVSVDNKKRCHVLSPPLLWHRKCIGSMPVSTPCARPGPERPAFARAHAALLSLRSEYFAALLQALGSECWGPSGSEEALASVRGDVPSDVLHVVLVYGAVYVWCCVVPDVPYVVTCGAKRQFITQCRHAGLCIAPFSSPTASTCGSWSLVTARALPQVLSAPAPSPTLLSLTFDDGSLETLTLILRWCYVGTLEGPLMAPLLKNVAVVEEALHAADMLLLSDMQVCFVRVVVLVCGCGRHVPA